MLDMESCLFTFDVVFTFGCLKLFVDLAYAILLFAVPGLEPLVACPNEDIQVIQI